MEKVKYYQEFMKIYNNSNKTKEIIKCFREQKQLPKMKDVENLINLSINQMDIQFKYNDRLQTGLNTAEYFIMKMFVLVFYDNGYKTINQFTRGSV